ncbi:MAG: MarR family transcriptional regulator [Synergistaceae bacterium]|nr:MarR family transcriptional regulator [Synergistaceae bacterium]
MTDENLLGLSELFESVSRKLKNYGRKKLKPGETVLNPNEGQGKLLLILRETGNISQKDLIVKAAISSQCASTHLGKLETSGLIIRKHDPTDKRAVNIYLTERGKALEFQSEGTDDAFSCLTEKERDAFRDYLGRIETNIDNLLRNISR